MGKRELERPAPSISANKLEDWSRGFGKRFQEGPIALRKTYLGLFVDAVEVGDNEIRILGSKDVLAQALEARSNDELGEVRSLVQGWRPLGDSTLFAKKTPKFNIINSYKTQTVTHIVTQNDQKTKKSFTPQTRQNLVAQSTPARNITIPAQVTQDSRPHRSTTAPR